MKRFALFKLGFKNKLSTKVYSKEYDYQGEFIVIKPKEGGFVYLTYGIDYITINGNGEIELKDIINGSTEDDLIKYKFKPITIDGIKVYVSVRYDHFYIRSYIDNLLTYNPLPGIWKNSYGDTLQIYPIDSWISSSSSFGCYSKYKGGDIFSGDIFIITNISIKCRKIENGYLLGWVVNDGTTCAIKTWNVIFTNDNKNELKGICIVGNKKGFTKNNESFMKMNSQYVIKEIGFKNLQINVINFEKNQ